MFETNRERLLQAMPAGSWAVFECGAPKAITGDTNYLFSPNRNFYYLTGLDEPECKVLFVAGQEPVLYIRRPDPVKARWLGENLSKGSAMVLSGMKDVRYLDEFPEQLAGYALSEAEKDALLTRLRLVKDEWEILRIQEAIRITAEGIAAVASHLKPGMIEYEAEAYFDYVLKKNGVRLPAFTTIMAGGPHSCVLHYEDNDSRLMAGDLLLMDCGATAGYYSGDITRTFPVSGKFTDRQRAFYDIVLEGNERIIDAAEPGVTLRELNEKLRAFYREALGAMGMVRTDEDLNEYYFHGVSHFLGLNTHDVGDREVVLEPGMVLTVEPGLYIAKEDIGIRIEDDVLVTDYGSAVLTDACPKTAEEVEAMVGTAYAGK